jgi:hypothetical protein
MSDEQAGSDAYAIVLADLYKRRGEIDVAIKAIEAFRGTGVVGGTLLSNDLRPAAVVAFGAERQDYLGLSIAEAAKKFLAAQRKTMNSAEIADGLKAANFPMTAADPSNVVGSVLSRRFDAVGDVVRVSRGQWGLPEWYPNRNFRKKERDGGVKKPEQELEPKPEESDHPNPEEPKRAMWPGTKRSSPI